MYICFDQLAVADTSEVSQFAVQNCWLEDSLSTKYNATAVKENATAVRLSVAQAFVSGSKLSVHCFINQKEYTFSDNVFVTNFRKAVEQSSVNPSILILGADRSVLVRISWSLVIRYIYIYTNFATVLGLF